MLALLVTVFAFWFLPDAPLYKLTLEQERTLQSEFGTYHAMFYDLNSNGDTELVESGPNSWGNHGLPIRYANYNTHGQWNFPGELPQHGQRFFIGDTDRNGFAEVFAFSVHEDTLLLHYFEPMLENGLYRKNIRIDKIRQSQGRIDFFLLFGGIVSLDNSGFDYFVFGISAGYSLFPRKIYAYCPSRNKLLKSPDLGAGLTQIHSFAYQGNAGNGLLVSNYSSGNYRVTDTTLLHDQSAWLIALDNQLQFLFSPLQYPGFTSKVNAYPALIQNEYRILAFHSNTSDCDTCNHVAWFDGSGSLIEIDNLKHQFADAYPQIIALSGENSKTTFVYNHKTGKIYQLSDHLDLKFIRQVPKNLRFPAGRQHFHLLGSKFYFCQTADGFALLREDFRHLAQAHILNPSLINSQNVSLYFTSETAPKIAVQSGTTLYLYRIEKNPFYFTRWLLLIGLYFGFVGLFYLSRQAYKKQVKRRQVMVNEILVLQFQTLSNQIDPHFIFNALNSITSAINKNNTEEAYNHGVKFSRLMREALLDSEKITRSLEKELQFVQDYLELERFRFQNCFEVELAIADGVPLEIEIPKMFIQLFAENAVKHGLKPLNSGGRLRINIEVKGKMLHIVIEDNGVGRKGISHDEHLSIGKGIAIADQLCMLYRKLYNRKISYRIIDLETNIHGHTGTRVRVEIEMPSK